MNILKSDRLARVRWAMGQTLLPEHLAAQEDSLAAESHLRFRATGLPAHGVVRLQWNASLLPEGVLAVQTLIVILPSGLLVDIPGNAQAAPLNLNTPGRVRVPVYVHVLTPDEATDGLEQYPGEVGDGISRRVHRLVFSTDQAHGGALESMRLGVFHKDPEGGWGLASDTLPPLLQVGASPFLSEDLTELEQLLEVFQHKVAQEIAASYLSGDSMFSAKECLKSILRTQRLLANLAGQIHLHPYYLYEVLKELLTEVAFYRDAVPEQITAPYDHEDLGNCFHNILAPLKQHIRLFQHRSPYLPFILKDGIHQLDFPEEVREAKEIYLLIQKSKVHDRVTLDACKISGRSRLGLIHKLALQGVPLKKIERPPFQHKFGPEVDFYQLQEGDEWDQALQELSLVFYDLSQMKGARFYLYWRGR